MPYKEIGTIQDFQSWETESAMEYLIAGQMGVYGYQPTPATPTVNLDALNLNAIKAALDASGKVTVKYLRLSWNQSGAQVTDFVFAFVADINRPISFWDLWAYLPADLVQALTQLNFDGNAFTVYLLGLIQSANTYKWTWTAQSDEIMVLAPDTPPTDATVRSEILASGKIEEAIATMIAESLKEGYQLTVRSYELVKAEVEIIAVYPPLPPMYKQGTKYRTHVIVDVDFDSNKPITQSPIAPAIIIAIGIAIAAIIAGLAIYTYLNNISTVSSEVTTRITNPNDYPVTVHTPQGDVTIPAGGTYEFTETTHGGWETQLPLIIIGSVGLILLFLFASKFVGRGKGE